MGKRLELKRIAGQIARCRECKKGKTGKPVAGEGNPNAQIVFIGEAPGKTEAEAGRPFVGRAGKLLRSIIKDIGMDEKDVFITNPVKYLPLKGTPSTSDIKHGKTHLDRQIEAISPKMIVLLGRVAVQAVLEGPVFVKKDHGKVIEQNGRKHLITYHPSAALRFPPLKKPLAEDLAKLKNIASDN